MSGTSAWTRSRDRMRRFPELFAQCAAEAWECLGIPPEELEEEATAYGKCVSSTTTAGRQELRKDMCVKEFEALKTCFISAAKKGVK